jgi:DNA-binding transcriptional MerR regulator
LIINHGRGPLRPPTKPILEEALPYTTKQISEITGASLRQLQWWDENGVVKPMIVDHKRQYSARDAIVVAIIMELRQRGVSWEIAKRLGEASRSVFETARYLLTDGDTVHVVASAETAAEIASAMGRSVLLDIQNVVGRFRFIPLTQNTPCV